MKTGAFSISLNVKNIKASKEFYEKLGFNEFAGDISQNYLIMKNNETIIGLFQGMFENNLITFNPGWDQNARNLDSYTDIREIQKYLKSKSLEIIDEADEKTEGPESFMIKDPDGNTILFDQHI